MCLFKNLMLMTMLSLSSGYANAQDGDRTGNGGGEDGVFKGIRDQVGSWMLKNHAIHQLEAKLELKSMNGAALVASYSQAVKDVGEKVIFTQKEIKIGENSRICINKNKSIICNVGAWNAAHGDTRYLIVFHEYLGVAGIETNVEVDYSQYPISSKILGFVHTKQAFELGMEKVSNPTPAHHETYCIGQFYSQAYMGKSYAVRCGLEEKLRYYHHQTKQEIIPQLAARGINFVRSIGSSSSFKFDIYKIGNVEVHEAMATKIVRRFVGKRGRGKDLLESIQVWTGQSIIDYEEQIGTASNYGRVKDIMKELRLRYVGIVNDVDPLSGASQNVANQIIIVKTIE